MNFISGLMHKSLQSLTFSISSLSLRETPKVEDIQAEKRPKYKIRVVKRKYEKIIEINEN